MVRRTVVMSRHQPQHSTAGAQLDVRGQGHVTLVLLATSAPRPTDRPNKQTIDLYILGLLGYHCKQTNRDGFEASMLEAKAKARPGRGQAKAKSAKTSEYRVLECELEAKVVSGIWTAE